MEEEDGACCSTRMPPLAARLETRLREHLAAADAAGTGWTALDAHRRAFEEFVAATTTYRPLLLRIKAAYDATLRDAAASALDGAHLRGELATAPARLAAAVQAAREAAERDAASMHAELEAALALAEGEAAQAEADAAEAEAELDAARRATAITKREAEAVAAANAGSRAALLMRSSWAGLTRARPGGGGSGDADRRLAG